MPSQEQLEARARVALLLREEMKVRDWTMAELARRAGTPNSAIKAILDETRGVGVSLGKRLATALGLELNDLLTEDGGALVHDTEAKTKPRKISPRLRRLLGVTADLPEDDQTTLLTLAISLRKLRRKTKDGVKQNPDPS